MREINGKLPQELLNDPDPGAIYKAPAHAVKTYRELMELAAKLAYSNKDHLLFFRGQDNDYKNKAGSSTFYPSIYRGRLREEELTNRFEVLDQASKKLVEAFKSEVIDGSTEIRRKKYMQWSILQHYEVCDTPLLDFTHSVRVACSFAQLKNKNSLGYVYVFGFPYLTNRISRNSEHDLVTIRLLSICPSDALRPYYQDGYLAGTEDITEDYGDDKVQLDFKRRLIAKFEIPIGGDFWGEDLAVIPESVLYPENDQIEELCKGLR